MMKPARLLIPCLWLAACQTAPPETPDWAGFLGQVDRMDAQQLQMARETAMRQYVVQPTDVNRLRAAYAVSRPGASLEQLAQSRDLLAEIAAASDLAPMRDLLDAEIRQSMAVQEAQGRVLELQAQRDDLQARLGELQTQLDALKSIEKEMVESQQQADEMRR
ncbi:MAG: hypothetical protein MUE63_00655 [Xanthomonadales bacterium]|jgi:hypothetical protein|nr:hypothetical protein [Xanthomonadales bacterium]